MYVCESAGVCVCHWCRHTHLMPHVCVFVSSSWNHASGRSAPLNSEVLLHFLSGAVFKIQAAELRSGVRSAPPCRRRLEQTQQETRPETVTGSSLMQ